MSQSKTDRIFAALRQRIDSGDLPEGSKLMSLRQAAEQYGASKNIIVTVYDRLVAHGLARSRQGSGFYVSRVAPSIAAPTNLREASDTVSLLHVQLDRPYKVLAGDGRPPESWLLTSVPAVTLRQGEGGYGSPHGLLALRECIAAAQIAAGLDATPAQIVTTFGANNGLDLLIRRFTRPGDTVLVDDPGYYPLFSKLKLAEVNFVGIPRTPKGPDPDALEAAAEQHRARLFFTQSLAQNPTGCSIDLPTAHAILKVADRRDLLVIDDDPFVDLPGVTGTRLAALDQFRRVIQIGSYSKILSPSLRSGYIIAEPEIAASLAELKMILAVNSSNMTERLIAEAILSRRFEKVRVSMSRRLERARADGMDMLARMGFELFAPPDNGLYSIVSLPEGLDDIAVTSAAASQGILLAPGSLFCVSGRSRSPSIRVNWSRVQDSRFYSFLRSLA
ncbi:transcriptional regulator, GntR family protein [Pseudooceanicola batsensis HTCC2597]|uniref:Transcriptional regulator, GntR family protein n=1 Tax=Pseudooceanicola batsensis (strain ATCC BAA-863 / DSM 15984 / KCTC 12145 / HTCC2597) TaxID=252305 RepID=A3U2Z7_PSEBH|nr:PLP-dependent aminotransferase family protein [Pseudooceanicola batsensis]EAQ01527.1 transcriptional regulator, GntR family protein [Pseudooceanicola batsensis HTCC2597]